MYQLVQYVYRYILYQLVQYIHTVTAGIYQRAWSCFQICIYLDQFQLLYIRLSPQLQQNAKSWPTNVLTFSDPTY